MIPYLKPVTAFSDLGTVIDTASRFTFSECARRQEEVKKIANFKAALVFSQKQTKQLIV